jgi:hypothetical protein
MKTLEPEKKSAWRKPCRAITYEETTEGCWVCTSHKPAKSGYPRIRRNKVLFFLHRYVYAKYVGEIPTGYCVMHLCDNRKCINPKHLKAGTIADNNKDMWGKGRGKVPPRPNYCPPPRYGEDNNKTTLTEKQVVEIRQHPISVTHTSLAPLYNVDRSTISNIRNRRTWKHVY